MCDLDIEFSGGRYFDNLFFIDFEASMTNPNAQHALESLQVSSSYDKNIISISC